SLTSARPGSPRQWDGSAEGNRTLAKHPRYEMRKLPGGISMARAIELFLALFRIAYGLFFIAVDAWVAIAVSRGQEEIFPQPTRAATAFSTALADTGFVNPLMAATFLAGGLCLLF